MVKSVHGTAADTGSSLGVRPRPRLVISTVVAAAVTLAAWRTGDWWVEGYDGAGLNLTAARLVLFLGVFGLVYALPALARRMNAATGIVFAAWTAYLSVWLVGNWPGLIMTDTVDVLTKARQGIVYEWFSYLHSLFNLAVLDVVPQVAAFGVIHVIGTAALMAYASSIVIRRGGGGWPVVVMNLLAAMSAPVIVNTLLYSRDTPYALLHVFLALWVADVVVCRRTVSRAGLVGIAALTGFLSVYRGDGIVLALVVPGLLLLLRPDRRALLRGAAVFAGFLVAFHLLLPAALSTEQRQHAYELSLRLNPLGVVLQSDFYSPTKDADLQTLGRVIDVDAATRISTPLEIPVLWNGHWNEHATEAEFEAFERVSNRLIRDNIVTVLAGRVETFGATTGLAPGGLTGAEQSDIPDRHTWIADLTGMRGSPPITSLYDVQADLLRKSTTFGGLPASRLALFWNFLPALLLMVGAALGFRRFPFEAAFSVVILSRVPLVFALAPAAQFKYYYAVYLGGIVVTGLLLTRLLAFLRDPGRRRLHVAGPRVTRLVQFAGASGAGLALDYAVYTALAASGVDAGWANAVSATAAVTFVFLVSARRIFESEDRFLVAPFLLYALYQVIAVGAASWAVDRMTDVFDGRYLLGKTVVVPFSFLANFLFMSWLFAKRQRTPTIDSS